MRDSKNPDGPMLAFSAGPVLAFSAGAWQAFTARIKSGDHNPG